MRVNILEKVEKFELSILSGVGGQNIYTLECGDQNMAAGISTVKVEPSPGSDSTVMWPR